MSLGMLSLMAGLAQGYERGQQRDLENQRQATMDQLRVDAAGREQTLFDQQQAERQGLSDAAAPVVPQAAPPMDTGGVTVDDQGNPLPPQAPMATVNGQRVPADAAGPMAAAANTPDAVQTRQLAFMQKANPVKAASMQANMMRAEADKLEVATKKWNSDVDTAKSKGLEGLIKLADESHADGEGGAVKSQVIYSPDNSTFTIGRLMPDGSVQPTKMPPLPNNEEGINRLAASLQRGVPPDRIIAHYDQVANQRADNVRADRLADSTIRYHTAMAEAANTRAGAAETRAEGAGAKSMAEKMPEADKIAYNAAIKRREKVQETIDKAKADGTWDPEKTPSHKSLQTDLDAANMKASLLEKRYTGNDIGGSDPYGARGGGAKSTTRPATGMETVMQDMRARGVTDATVDDRGQKTVIGKGATSVPAVKAASPLNVSPTDIPPPPAPTKNIPGPNGFGGKTVPNPEYAIWQRAYGQAWDEKTRQEEAAGAAATSAARRGPYLPERAPYATMSGRS